METARAGTPAARSTFERFSHFRTLLAKAKCPLDHRPGRGRVQRRATDTVDEFAGDSCVTFADARFGTHSLRDGRERRRIALHRRSSVLLRSHRGRRVRGDHDYGRRPSKSSRTHCRVASFGPFMEGTHDPLLVGGELGQAPPTDLPDRTRTRLTSNSHPVSSMACPSVVDRLLEFFAAQNSIRAYCPVSVGHLDSRRGARSAAWRIPRPMPFWPPSSGRKFKKCRKGGVMGQTISADRDSKPATIDA